LLLNNEFFLSFETRFDNMSLVLVGSKRDESLPSISLLLLELTEKFGGSFGCCVADEKTESDKSS